MKRVKIKSESHHTESFTKLHSAVVSGDLEKVKAICTPQNVNDTAGERFHTPLYCAALHNIDTKIILHLLSMPACDIDKTCNGVQPIIIAALNGYKGPVDCLLREGAEVDETKFNLYAERIKEKNPEIFKTLQKAIQDQKIAKQTTSPHSWGNNGGTIAKSSSASSLASTLTKRTPRAHPEGTEMLPVTNNNHVVKI